MSEEGPIRYDAVIFDMDSTLLDTYPATCSALELTLCEMGYHGHRVRRIAKNMWGEDFQDMLKHQLLAAGGDPALFDHMMPTVIKHFSVELLKKEVKTFAGMDQLLSALSDLRIMRCVLSNTPDPYVRTIVDLFYPGVFDCVYGLCDAVPAKPKPDGLLYIAEQISVSPDRIMVIGDAMEDVLAAHSAGADCLLAKWAGITGVNQPLSGFEVTPTAEVPLDCLAYLF